MQKDINQQYVNKLCKDYLKYEFKDKSLLSLALTHRSCGNENNERLEFLGDSLLNYIISYIIFEEFSTASEGELTRIRAELVSRKMLAELSKEIFLGDCIMLGLGESGTGGHQRTSILANVFEAILGAIYLDSSMEELMRVIKILYGDKIKEVGLTGGNKDAKTKLQEWLQAKKQILPEYRVLKIEGKPHQQTFYVECKVVPFDEIVVGTASSRRQAEQDAASKMLEIINNLERA